MKKKLVCLLALVAFLMIGCIDVTTKVILKPDGSGTIEETILMSNSVLEMLASFSEDTTTEETFNLYDEKKVQNEALEFGEGVVFIRGEEVETEGKKGYKAYYAFEDISKLKMSSDPSDKMPEDGVSGEQPEERDLIKFSFTKGASSKLEIFMPLDPEELKAEFDNEEVATDSAEIDPMVEQFKDILAEMKITILLEIDGKVINSNATYLEENQITLLQISFKDLFNNQEKFEEFAKAKPENFNETRELLKDLPGIKFEMNDKVYVEFE